MNRFLLLAAVAAVAAPAQVATYKGLDFSIGARAGILLNRGNRDAQFTSQSSMGFFRNHTQRPVLGPTFEVGFRQRWALEFSPTWRRGGYSSYGDNNTPFPAEVPRTELIGRGQYFDDRTNTWDLPLVGKFYFTTRDARIRPFVGAGGALSRSSRQFLYFNRLESAAGEKRLSSFENNDAQWGRAPVAAAGVAFRSGRFSIVPEFRYLRDTARHYPAPRNRAEFFLGFRF